MTVSGVTSRPAERIHADRDQDVVDERDDRADRHLQLEAERDVERDRRQDDEQADRRLAGDLAAPRRTDVLDVHVHRVDTGLLGEVSPDHLRTAHALDRERRRPDRDRLVVHDLDLRIVDPVVLEGRLNLLGAHRTRERVGDPRASLEVDREVQSSEQQPTHRQQDHHTGDREPQVPALHPTNVRDRVTAIGVDRLADVHRPAPSRAASAATPLVSPNPRRFTSFSLFAMRKTVGRLKK